MIEKQAHILDQGKKAMAELIMDIDMLKRRRMIHENPHAPPSHGSVPAQQKKTRSAKRNQTCQNRLEGQNGLDSGPQARPYRRLPPQKIKGGSTPQAGQVRQVRGRKHLDTMKVEERQCGKPF